MVSRMVALDRLNKEREYEDQLVHDLDSYFLACLDYIADMTDEEKRKVRKSLGIIMYDSMEHSYLFNQLAQMVFEGEEHDQF